MNRQARRRNEASYKIANEEEMNDLITHEENILNQAVGNRLRLGNKASHKQSNENEEDEEDEEIDFIDSQDINNGAAEKLQRVYKQLLKNKIKVDNVFDIQWDEKTKLADLDWQSSANFLDTISKVWGIKVEKTHRDTYKILGNLIRSEIQDPDEEADPNKKIRENLDLAKILSKSITQRASNDQYGAKTLEKNPDNLDVITYDIEFDVDPLFKKTSAKFDEQGASGLLINNLFMDANMMLMLESPQPNEQRAEQEERKEMLTQNNLTKNLSQECSNYWRIVDTNHLFTNKCSIAERLTNFKKLLSSTEDESSEVKLNNEVNLNQSKTRPNQQKTLSEQNIQAPTEIRMDVLNEDELEGIYDTGVIDPFGNDDIYGQTRQDVPNILYKMNQKTNSLGGFVVIDDEDDDDTKRSRQGEGGIRSKRETFIEAIIEEDNDDDDDDDNHHIQNGEEIKEERKDSSEPNKKLDDEEEEDEDEEEKKLKQQENDDFLDEDGNKIVLFTDGKIKDASDDEDDDEKAKASEDEESVEEMEEEEDDEGNIIKRKKIKGPLDFAGIDEKLKTVGRGMHKKFNEDFNELPQPKINKKKKKSKKYGDGDEENQKYFDFTEKSAEKADVILGNNKKKRTIKDYLKNCKFIYEESDHSNLTEKSYSKIIELLSNPFNMNENYLDAMREKMNPSINPNGYPDAMMDDNEDSLDINNNFKGTFALNYGNDEEDEDKFKEQKNHVKIRDLKRKLWDNIRAQILENHANFQKQKQGKKKQDKEEMEQIQFTNMINDLPKLFGESAKRVSMQSCFITILHLANEQTLKLSNQKGEDFAITKESKADLAQELLELQKQLEQEEKQEREKIHDEEEEEEEEEVENEGDKVKSAYQSVAKSEIQSKVSVDKMQIE